MRCGRIYREGLQRRRRLQAWLQHLGDLVIVLTVIFFSILSRGPKTDAQQPFGIGLVAKGEKVDKARLPLQNR